MPELPSVVTDLLTAQRGVVGRRQLLAVGATESDLRSWRRGRLLTPVQAGVYVDHTGELDWEQRAAAAVVRLQPAALHGISAVRARVGRFRQHDDGGPVHVAVGADRRVTGSPGVEVHRVVGLPALVQEAPFPPRVRLEEAVLQAVAAQQDDLAVVALLAEVVGRRWTTAQRLAESLARRPRTSRRTLVGAVLHDLTAGACSVLEGLYLRDVERAHGLPAADRQVRASARGSVYRDVLYAAYGVVVELDGRLDHTHVLDRHRDLERDLLAAVDGLTTVRLGHGQVGPRACATAVAVGRVLQRHGWTGSPRRCPRCTAVGVRS